MKRTIPGLLAVTLWLMVGCGKSADTSAKHPWASFKVGSYVKKRMTSNLTLAGKQIDRTSEITETLVELTAANVVLEIEVSVMGKTTKTRKEFPRSGAGVPSAAAIAGAGAGSAKVLSKGTETITVAGKPLTCQWTETSVTLENGSGTTKIYTCEQVPGFIVKMVTKMTGKVNSDRTSEVVDFLAK